VPLHGTLPLSYTLDSIGPIAVSVSDCALLDSVLADEPDMPFEPAPARGLRLAIPDRYMLEDMDATVARAFERAVKQLQRAGAQVETVSMPELDELADLLKGGGFAAAESYHFHQHMLAERADAYDPRVRTRIERGAAITAADYLELQRQRRQQVACMDNRLADFDALITPTVPVVPPRLHELEADEEYSRINLLVLRNPTVGNLLDLCAISLPCHLGDELPVGFMMLARNGTDRRLLQLAAGVEQVLSDMRGLHA
jgi:aspartyl-tRNA(Asn)/glutamyl-tRNA(Gln) amidotransferase subunit A